MDRNNKGIETMDKETNKIINDYISLIYSLEKGLKRAFVFGSYAKNSNNFNDIDLALVIDKLKDSKRFDLQVELMMLAGKIDLRIEPHPISNANFNEDNPFAAEILKTGIEINLDKIAAR